MSKKENFIRSDIKTYTPKFKLIEPVSEEVAQEIIRIKEEDKKIGCPENQSEAYIKGFLHGIRFLTSN